MERSVPIIPYKKIASRALLSLALVVVLYLSSWWKDRTPSTFVSQLESVHTKSQTARCSSDYIEESRLFPECAPRKCGRVVSDIVVTADEVSKLLQVAQKGLALSRSDGGASILDLHSGSVSHGQGFVNVYKLAKEKGVPLFDGGDFDVYTQMKNKVRDLVSHQFGVMPKHLHLTHPTFFSEMSVREPRTVHDEYWHTHVDKETYESFHYTSLVYLSDYGLDFHGGRLVFVSPAGNVTVEPKRGRVVAFTSGSENPHHVERVVRGLRYALTVSFSCDPAKAIADPRLHA